MKIRTLTALAAVCLSATILLSSCGSFTITTPDGSDTVTTDKSGSTDTPTKNEYAVMDFSKEDITKYIVLGNTEDLKLTYNVGIS